MRHRKFAPAALSSCEPGAVHGIGTSPVFVASASEIMRESRASFDACDSEILPVESNAYDVVVLGLVFNFLPNVEVVVGEMHRTVKPGGIAAACVWYHGGKMEIMRRSWDVATSLDPTASALEQGARKPVLCEPQALIALFEPAGLTDISIHSIDAPADFENCDDYWLPFTGNQGPAPRYVASLDPGKHETLKEQLRSKLLSRQSTVRLAR